MKNPASDVSRLPSSRKRRKGHKTTPPPSPVEAIWNELCSWMVSQTLRKTSKTRQETDFRLLPALLEQFWGQDSPCPAPFLQALTNRLIQDGPFQRQQKQHPGLRGRLFSALLRLDAGRGLVLPFVEACLPRENDPEVLSALIESWPPGLVCPETIWEQWCKKTPPPVNAREDGWGQRELRQLAWQALFQLPAPERDPTGSPHWLSFLRQQLKFETSPQVLESIWSGLNRLGRWPTSAKERTAWLAELERHSPCGSKASDRFVTRYLREAIILREAVIWRVLFGMHADETDASVLSRELLSRYLSDYLKTPCLLDEYAPSLLLKTMAMLPVMEHDRRVWLDTWGETGAMPGGSSVSRKLFWEVMVRAQEAGLYPAEETMEAAIRTLGSETDFDVFDTAASWVPPAGRLQKLWFDLWEPYMFSEYPVLKDIAWRAWRPAGDGYETFCSRLTLTGTSRHLRRRAAKCLLRWDRTEMTQERWHAWWAQWVRQESYLLTLEELSCAMQDWQPLPEVIVSAWRERGQGGERDAEVRRLAWQVLVSQPVDLSQDIIHHLPGETDPKVLETMAGWSPGATPVPADFWKEWGKKLATLFSSSYGDGSFLLDPLVTCCLKWRPAKPDQVQEMWTMWEQIFPHCPTNWAKNVLKLMSNAPFLAPPDSPYLLNLVTNEQCKFDDIVRMLNLVANSQYEFNDIARIFSKEGEFVEKISSFTGKISDPSLWEQQAEDIISEMIGYKYWRVTDCPEEKNCLRSFQWICEQSRAQGRGLLPGWNTLRPVLESQSFSPEVELFFFSLVRKWGSPEGWQAWWGMAAARENRDHSVLPGGCCGMIRRVYLVERLAAGTAACGEGADETTLRRLFRLMKQQWWRAEDVQLWPWLGELVEKAVAAGEGPGLRKTGSAVLSDRIWTLASGLPAWELRSTSGQVSDFHPAHSFSPSLS